MIDPMDWTFRKADQGQGAPHIYTFALAVVVGFWGMSFLSFGAIPFALSILIGIAVLAVVGLTLVAAHRALAGSGGLFSCLFGYGLALFSVVGFVGFVAPTVAGQGQQQLNPPTLRPLPIRDGVVFLEGEIDFRLFDALQRLVDKKTPVEVVSLNSLGGAVHAARGLARLVRENGLDTVASGPCYSACTLIFIAGNRRKLGPNGMLGFHSYAAQMDTSTGKIPLGSTLEQQNTDRAVFAQAGVETEFLDKMFEAPHQGLWRPNRQALSAAGVTTD